MKFKYFLCGLMTFTSVRKREDCVKNKEEGVDNSPELTEHLLRSSLLKLRYEIQGQFQDVHCIAFLVSKNVAYSAANCLVKATRLENKGYISTKIDTLRLETIPNESQATRTYKALFFKVHSCFDGDESEGWIGDIGIIQLDLQNIDEPNGPFLNLDLKVDVELTDEVAIPEWNSDLSSITLNYKKQVRSISECYTKFKIHEDTKKICVEHQHGIEFEILPGSPLIIRGSVAGILSHFAKKCSPYSSKNHAVYVRLKSYENDILKPTNKFKKLEKTIENYPPRNQFFKETTNSAVSEIGECSRTQKTPENSSPQSLEETLKSSLIKLRRVINKEVYQVHCIGFLISKQYAYSAAHCLVLDRFINDFAYMRQQINTLRVETLPNVSRGLRGFMYKVQFFLVHSHFKGNKAIGYTADFGIIKLDSESSSYPVGPFLKVDLDYKIKLVDKVGILEWTSDLNSFDLEYLKSDGPINECLPSGNKFTAANKADKICVNKRGLFPTKVLAGSPVLVTDRVVGMYSFFSEQEINKKVKHFLVHTALGSYKLSIENANEISMLIAQELENGKMKRPLTFQFGDSIA